jgi:EmrB/QacA subfamily drug resistance transporter
VSIVHPNPRQSPNATFVALSAGALAYVLLQSLVVPALPTLQVALHTSQSTVSWILTAYLLSASVATPVLGRLGDMFGKERMLVIVLCALTAGSLVAALTSSIGVMIAARVLQGLGGAVFPLAFGIIRDEFPRERVAGAIGGVSTILGVGGGLGIILAGPIVDHLNYHWLFWIPLVMTALATVATFFWVPESPVKTPGSVNVGAGLLLSGWLIALLLGVSEGSNWGWSSARVLGLFAASVVLFAAWVLVELRSRVPLVDVRLMRTPIVWWTNISALLFGFGMYSMMVVLPEFMESPRQAGYGFAASVTGAGAALIPATLAMIVIGMVIGPITRAIGSKVPLVLGGFIGGAGFAFLAAAHSATWQVYVATALAGVGMGLAFSAMTNLIVEAVPSTQTGVATGMNANIRTVGGAIGSQVVVAVITSGVAAAALPQERGYVLSFLIMAVGMVAAGMAALLVPGAVKRARVADGPAFAGAVEPLVESSPAARTAAS